MRSATAIAAVTSAVVTVTTINAVFMGQSVVVQLFPQRRPAWP
jgi:hypothetical protein